VLREGPPFPCWSIPLITQRGRSHTCPLRPTLGLDEHEVDRSWPAPQTLSAVNFLFRISVERGPADKALAWYVVGRVFAETCHTMHKGLAEHYRMPAEALRFFDIPHVHSVPFVEAIARIIARYAPTAAARTHLRQVAEAIVVYEREFYDALVGAGAISAP
jgi:pyrroloquinoline quinone (PQQ) biosynthesis protein C